MDKDRDEGTEKRSKATVKKTVTNVTKETSGAKTTVESDGADGTHYTVEKTTSKGNT